MLSDPWIFAGGYALIGVIATLLAASLDRKSFGRTKGEEALLAFSAFTFWPVWLAIAVCTLLGYGLRWLALLVVGRK